MDIITLEEAPAQRFPITLGDTTLVVDFSYNQLADRWSYAIWDDQLDCPKVAGFWVEINKNLLYGISTTHKLLVVPAIGASIARNQYTRFTKARKSGFPDVYFALGTVAEFEELTANVADVQPFC